jgi:hypothetical protein
MKVKHSRELKNGKRHMLVELDPRETIMTFNEDWYYRLGGQVEDIVQGHVLTESEHVIWCSIEQRWLA